MQDERLDQSHEPNVNMAQRPWKLPDTRLANALLQSELETLMDLSFGPL